MPRWFNTAGPCHPSFHYMLKVVSLTLRNFGGEEVGRLLGQHTTETGQQFSEAAIRRVVHLTAGQPFLVNALARAATRAVPDRGVLLTEGVVEQQAQALLMARTTHLRSLQARLDEPRVAAVIQRILLGDEDAPLKVASDDFEYVVDLGLVDRTTHQIANPLYREVITRQLTLSLQENLRLPLPWVVDGRLDLEGLIGAFRQWWRENAQVAAQTASAAYPEVLPHLTFMAFLQRLVNGGGVIEREYAAGRGRIDLLVTYGGRRYVIELKRVPPGRRREAVCAVGEGQLAGYLDSLGVEEGWLLVFDQNPGLTWEDRVWDREVARDGKRLHLRGA